MRNKRLACAFLLTTVLGMPKPAVAIPIFAQRYQLRCDACHSVLPELNTFGNQFRASGYRLPIPKHGTTGVAVRYQLEYEKDPASGNRRFAPGAVVLGSEEIGAVNAFVHYNLGAGGGPGGMYLAYLATYNAHTRSLYRAGLIELPLLQSPGQRLDDLAPYGYYGARAGLNDLALSSPRWGVQIERHTGNSAVNLVVDAGEFRGSAYGGKPVATGETTAANVPEVGIFVRAPLFEKFDVSAAILGGARRISPIGRGDFVDTYRRYALGGHARLNRLDVQAEQWWGSDANADGLGTAMFTSGGYARLKYYATEHLYVAARYDAAATPFAARTLVLYAAGHVTPHARLLIERRQPLGSSSPGSFGAALTVGFPWPSKL